MQLVPSGYSIFCEILSGWKPCPWKCPWKLDGPLRFFLSKHFYHSYLCCGEECDIFLLEHIDHSWITVVASLGTFHGFLIKDIIC